MTVPDALYRKGCIKNVQEGVKVRLQDNVRREVASCGTMVARAEVEVEVN